MRIKEIAPHCFKVISPKDVKLEGLSSFIYLTEENLEKIQALLPALPNRYHHSQASSCSPEPALTIDPSLMRVIKIDDVIFALPFPVSVQFLIDAYTQPEEFQDFWNQVFELEQERQKFLEEINRRDISFLECRDMTEILLKQESAVRELNQLNKEQARYRIMKKE